MKMEYNEFVDLIRYLEKDHIKIRKAYDINIDLINFNDDLHKAISILVKESFGEHGAEIFEWFCYECDFGRNMLEFRVDDELRCQNIPDLFLYLTKLK
jgi:hypothetical protein